MHTHIYIYSYANNTCNAGRVSEYRGVIAVEAMLWYRVVWNDVCILNIIAPSTSYDINEFDRRALRVT